MNGLRDRWNRIWFSPAAPDDLGISRCLFFASIFVLYLGVDFASWGDVSKVFWMPTIWFRVLRVPAVGSDALGILAGVWKISLLLSAVGLWTRVSTLAAFTTGAYLLGLPHNFGKIHHFDAMVVLVLAVMAVSRSGDAYSVDAVLARRRNPGAVVQSSGEYSWPVLAVRLVLSSIFFGAGISKIRHGGVEWITSDNMAVLFVSHAYQISSVDPLWPSGALWLAQHPRLCSLMALMTVVVEAGYPLALVSRRARWFFPPVMCATLVGIRLFMGPTFPQFLICHVFWIPWTGLLNRVRPLYVGGMGIGEAASRFLPTARSPTRPREMRR